MIVSVLTSLPLTYSNILPTILFRRLVIYSTKNNKHRIRELVPNVGKAFNLQGCCTGGVATCNMRQAL